MSANYSLALPFTEGLFRTRESDPACALLADRHYSRRTPGSPRFVYAGRSLIFRDAGGLVVVAWLWQRAAYRDDGRTGFHNVLFRNEGPRRSSEILLEAEALVLAEWGEGRAWTFIDPRKIKSPNPGYCYKAAGWRFIELTAGNRRPKKHVLAKDFRLS